MGLFYEEGGRKWESREMGNFITFLCPEPWGDSYKKRPGTGSFLPFVPHSTQEGLGTLDLAVGPVLACGIMGNMA